MSTSKAPKTSGNSMRPSSAAPRPKARTRNWEEAYLDLEQKYLQMQKNARDREEIWKLEKVEFRKKQGKVKGDAHGGKEHVQTPTKRQPSPRRATTQQAATSLMHVHPSPAAPAEFIPAPRLAGSVSDLEMVWGVDTQMALRTHIETLINVNQQLRSRLEVAEEEVGRVRHEASMSKNSVGSARQQLDDAHSSLHQVVRDRDLAAQKLDIANSQVKTLQQAQLQYEEEKQRIRFNMNSQIRDLRAKLTAAAEINENQSKEIHSLAADVKEKMIEYSAMQARWHLVNNELDSQRHANESLVMELTSLNNQLASERRRGLALQRDVQVAVLNRDRSQELMKELDMVRQEKHAVENENLRLLDEASHAASIADERARHEVREEISELKEAAAHWEHVCQLQFKDIARRTQSHQLCRAECDEAKKNRDEAELAARALRLELQLAEAKLELTWPSHRKDTQGLDAAQVRTAFSRLRETLQNRYPFFHARPTAAPTNADNSSESVSEGPSLHEQLLELQEANSLLLAEVESLRVSNELLSQKTIGGSEEKKQQELMSQAEQAKKREALGQKIISDQGSRIQFLEAQVASLRGSVSETSASLQNLDLQETIVELFIGQMIAPQTSSNPAIHSLLFGSPLLFATVDFLLHETVVTPVVTDLNAFFDATFAFRIKMDHLLMYYLRNRCLTVRLFRLTSDTIPTDSAALMNSRCEFIAEGSVPLIALLRPPIVDSPRPLLKGHVPLLLGDASDTVVSSVEFAAVVRTPFTDAFVKIAQDDRDATSMGPLTVHDASTSSRVANRSGVAPLAIPQCSNSFLSELRSVEAVTFWVHSAQIAFHSATLPLLSVFYQVDLQKVGDSPGDAPAGHRLHSECWIMPPSPTPKHECAFNHHETFQIRNERELFALLRSVWTIVLWDEGCRDPDRYWGVALQPHSPMLLTEVLTIPRSAVDIKGPDGSNLGTLYVGVELHRDKNVVSVAQVNGAARPADPTPAPPPQAQSLDVQHMEEQLSQQPPS